MKTLLLVPLLALSLALVASCSQEKTCARLTVTTVDGKIHDYNFGDMSVAELYRYKRSGDSITIWEDLYPTRRLGEKAALMRSFKTSIEGVSIVKCLEYQ